MAVITPSMSRISVRDAMHRGIISVDVETTLRQVAKAMGECRVHAGQAAGVVSTLDVVAAYGG